MQSLFNTNIVLAKQSFIAFINYHRAEKELYIVLRSNGKRYRYKNVPLKVFSQICSSQNKGSYIAQHIIHSRSYPVEEMNPLPLATLEQIILPKKERYWLGR